MTNALDPHPLVWESRVRGSLLGLALGESLAFAEPFTLEPLLAGPATHLAAFSAEGTIRASMRSLHKGICHPPSVLWAAYCRWGRLQGLLPEERNSLDGWLAGVPLLRERRGDAPATVAAMQDTGPGSRETPIGQSLGWHAMVRGVPFAALSGQVTWSDVRMAAECAALTHGHPRAWTSASAAARLLNRLLAARSGEDDFVDVVTDAMPGLDGEVATGLRTTLWAAGTRPGDREALLSLASTASAPAVLMGSVYTVASFPGRENVPEAMAFAATARERTGVSAMTGALLGAMYGVEVWPAAVLMRHELVWVLDTLARDLVRQLTANPGGSEYAAPDDPQWPERYPGW